MLTPEEVNKIKSKKYNDLTDEEKVIYSMGYDRATNTYSEMIDRRNRHIDTLNRQINVLDNKNSDLLWAANQTTWGA